MISLKYNFCSITIYILYNIISIMILTAWYYKVLPIMLVYNVISVMLHDNVMSIILYYINFIVTLQPDFCYASVTFILK